MRHSMRGHFNYDATEPMPKFEHATEPMRKLEHEHHKWGFMSTTNASSEFSENAPSDINDALVEQLNCIHRAFCLNQEIGKQLQQVRSRSPEHRVWHETPASRDSSPSSPLRLLEETIVEECTEASSAWSMQLQAMSESEKQAMVDAVAPSEGCHSLSLAHYWLDGNSISRENAFFGEHSTNSNNLMVPLLSEQPAMTRGKTKPVLGRHNNASTAPNALKRSQSDLVKESNDSSQKKRLAIEKMDSPFRMDAMFRNTDDIKTVVCESLSQQKYDVERRYSATGVWQAIARNMYFKNLTLLAVALNVVYIGVEADSNVPDTDSIANLPYFICDNIFCTFFLIEVVVRIMAFEKRAESLHDFWVLFDTVQALIMVGQTWVLPAASWCFDLSVGSEASKMRNATMFRMLRLLRVVKAARATKLLNSFPELLILSEGIVKGMRSVMAVLCMQVLAIYIFAIVFALTLRDSEVGKPFKSIPHGMNFLLIQVLCGPSDEYMNSLLKYHWLYYALFIVFILFGVFTLMNMLIGILCDAVITCSQESKDETFAKEVAAQIARLIEWLDEDGNGQISPDEFDRILKDPTVTSCFDNLAIDIVGLADFAGFIFEQCEEISFMHFAKMIGLFRGNKNATVKDVTDLRRYITTELIGLESRLFPNVGDSFTHSCNL